MKRPLLGLGIGLALAGLFLFSLLGPPTLGGQTMVGKRGAYGTLCYGASWDKLAFAIIFVGSTEEEDGTSSSKIGRGDRLWGGRLGSNNDPAMTYEADSGGAVINGVEYDYDHGRVFVVSHPLSGVGVKQLDWDIRDEDWAEELEQLGEREELLALLRDA